MTARRASSSSFILPLAGIGVLLTALSTTLKGPGPDLDVLTVYSVARYLSRSRFRGHSASYDEAQDLVEAVKNGHLVAIEDAADLLSRHPDLHRFRGVVVPVPRSEETRPSMLELSKAMVQRGVGTKVIHAAHRVTAVKSSRMLRRAKRPAVPPRDHLESFFVIPGMIPKNAPVLLVDDMVTEGNTLMGLRGALRSQGHQGPILGATVGKWCPSLEGLPEGAFGALVTEVQASAHADDRERSMRQPT